MTPIEEFLDPEAAKVMRQAITEAQGNEVFFVGRRSPDFPVGEVQVLARGHGSAVPAVLRQVRVGEVLIHNHPSGNLSPSDADLGIASNMGGMGVAFAIVDNPVRRLYVVVEPQVERAREALDEETVARLLGPESPIARTLPGYEHRVPQIAMAREVTRAFNQDKVTLIEAGTGTGKSLAYLLPAILYATKNHERVVVSTNTINLQEQLIGKDLPFLREHLGLEFRSALLMGRSNYVCLRKLGFASGERDNLFDEAGRQTFDALVEWTGKSEEGTRSDLPLAVPEAVWEEVASDGDDCLRAKSPFFSRCFYFRSRWEAARADIVVVNHHLLMADLATRAATGDYTGTAVLPPYDRVIVDEAHNLEDVASSYFGTTVTPLGLLRALGRLQPDGAVEKGVLAALEARVQHDPELLELVGEAIELRQQLGESIRTRFAALGRAALGWFGVDEPGREGLKARLKTSTLRHPAFAEGVLPECEALNRALGAYCGLLARLRKRAGEEGGEDETVVSALSRIEAVRRRLDAAAEALGLIAKETEETCRWIELRRTRRGELTSRLASAPLAAAELLAANVHGRVKTVVMTSATLTVGQSFEHFRDRLGVSRVPAQRQSSARLDSPFDFARQALLVVPTDMPEPQEPAFAEAVRAMVGEALRISQGRAFVLFTSYGLLDRTHARLERALQDLGLNPLKQGSAPRDQLLARFRRERGSVLFAVDSFWEGVDVPGEALSLVILVRLPFKVPTEPLQEARYEAIERQGGDPFLDYAVPQAVIKFRQGFGRLIRTREDRGAVLILDSRIATRRYGRLFLDSLPDLRKVVAPRDQALGELAGFFAALARG